MTLPAPNLRRSVIGLRRPVNLSRKLLSIAAVLAACGGLATYIDLPVARWMAGGTKAGGAADSAAPDTTATNSSPPDSTISRRPHGTRRLPGDVVRLVNLSEVFGYSPSAGIILLAALLLDPTLVRRRTPAGSSETKSSETSETKSRGVASLNVLCPPVSLTADAWRMVAITFSGGLTTDLIKLMVTRVRPYAAALDLHASATDTFSNIEGVAGVAMRSFPSGHAAVAAGLASALCWRYPRAAPLFIAIAAAAAAQRLTSGSHYVSDVTAGAAIAVAWAAFWLRAAERPNAV